jgi:pimeloyl-ACP methyl ester carboxylesterase
VDVSRSGPYDVTFEYLDILNPNDFNKSELYSIYQSNPNIIGQESQRCFYPKNIRSLTNIPIVLIMHGVGHQSQMYDFYGSLLASYGYFVLQTTTGTGPASSRIYSLIKQLKEQSSKIKSGYFFGKIDFTKIILIGHSFGGTNVLSLSADLQNNIISPSVSGLTFSDIVCGILLEFGSSPGTITDKWTNIPSLTINGSDAIYQNQSNPYALLNCKELQSDPSARDVFRGNIFIRNTRHDEMAHPVSAAQLFTFQPPLPVGNNGITMGYYSTGTGYIKNSNSSVYDYVGQLILKFISMMLKNKIKNIFKTYNNDYKNTIVKNIEYAVAFQYKLPSTDNIYFIDQLTDTTKFTGQTGYFIKETYKTGGNDFNTLLAASIGGSTVYLDYVNPNYNNGNYAFYHYTNTTKGFTYSYNSIPLDLTRSNTAKEINIVMGLVTEASSGGTSDVCITQNNHFSVYLTDNSGNTAMISSKQRNLGIPNANKQYVYSPQDNIQYNMYGYLPATNLVFSLQDFKNKNNLIDLTNISKIQLLFGSTYGTQLLKNELFVYNGMYLTGDT